MFEAYVTNPGLYPELGVEAGETLRFPTTTEEVRALFSRIGIDGERYEDFNGIVIILMLGSHQFKA